MARSAYARELLAGVDGEDRVDVLLRELGTVTLCLSIVRDGLAGEHEIVAYFEERQEEIAKILWHSNHVYADRIKQAREIVGG